MYKKHQPDVVLLDLVMPEFDGYYAIENIRKINPDAKIIVLTSSVQEYYGKKLVELKPYAIFIKPFMIKELVTMIEKDSNKLEQITV
ncbi:MAG: response regulator [Nitrosopumilus sp.]|nr:response regulator [Nitrosopumilus sp.]